MSDHHHHHHHQPYLYRRRLRYRRRSRGQDADDDVITDVTASDVTSPQSRVAGIIAAYFGNLARIGISITI